MLFWVGEMLGALGWHVQAVRWTPEDKLDRDPISLVTRAAEKAFTDSPPAGQRLIVAKSLSTLSIPWAEETQTSGVWLTPLLTDERIRTAIAGSSKDHLFIGGSEDKFWDGGRKSGSHGTFFEVPGADHALQIGDDWRASQRLQTTIFETIENFVLRLEESWGGNT